MTPKQAAKIFRRLKPAHEKVGAQVAEARKVLVAHFEATGTTELDGVGFAVDSRNQLDTAAVRAHLGDKIDQFIKAVVSRTVFLIEKVGV